MLYAEWNMIFRFHSITSYINHRMYARETVNIIFETLKSLLPDKPADGHISSQNFLINCELSNNPRIGCCSRMISRLIV